tara:strand:+ start:370 stop:624 length:255 start_codon:yes stop_codon:yes gene_type:complete
MIGEMTMDKVKIMLSSETYVQLYAELAERRMQALVDPYTGDEEVHVYDRDGNVSYSDWAQDEFNWEVGVIEGILANAGIYQEEG